MLRTVNRARKLSIRRLLSAAQHRFGAAPRLVNRSLLGHSLVVREGTLHETPDYDDAWLQALASHSEVILDVGSHLGSSALLCLLAAPTALVVLVEANPATLCGAAENLILNHLAHRARFVSAFAGEKDGETIRLWTAGTGSANSIYRGHATTAAKAGTSIETPTITLDTLCQNLSLTPDLIKLDAEGAEHRVLLGAKNLVGQRKTRFHVEVHSNPELPMRQNMGLILDWCKASGYAAWYHKEHRLLTEVETVAHRGRCHVLLQPQGWDYPEWLMSIEQGGVLAPASS